MDRIDGFFKKWSDKLIWVLIAAYCIIFTALSFLKYYSYMYFDWDFASDVITLWNSVHGRFLYYPFLEENIFGAHLYLIILLIIPVYLLFQSPLTLLFLQSLFLGLAAWPLYLLASSKLNKTFGVAIALAYLLYPSLGFINLFETHFEIFEVFFLFFALYYFEKAKFWNFLVFLFLAATCKENASLVVFMFGIYGAIRRRTLRWVMAPILLGLSWFLLAVKWIIPSFARDAKLYQEGFIFSHYYQHLGSNLLDMVKNLVLHPVFYAKYALKPHKILYIFQLFLPVGFMGFLSPAVLLMSLPIFLQNLLSNARNHSQIYFQYVALLIPFIFASVVFAFNKLLKSKFFYSQRNYLLSAFLLFSFASGFIAWSPQIYLVQHFKGFRVTDLSKEKDRLVKMIPPDAPVIATFQFMPRLANRFDLHSMHLVSTGLRMYTQTKYVPPENLEYALIDFNEPLLITSFFPPDAPLNIRMFLKEGDWRVLRGADDAVLFKKDHPGGARLVEVVEEARAEHEVNANINGQVVFLGYDVIEEGQDGRVLHLVYYWKRIADQVAPLGLFLQFLDSLEQVRFVNIHVLGYRVYGPSECPKDVIIKEHHYIVVPSIIAKGTYGLRAQVYGLNDSNVLPVVNGEKLDFLGRIILGEVEVP